MKRFRGTGGPGRWVLAATMLVIAGAAAGDDGLFAPALRRSDVAFDACRQYVDGKAQAARMEQVETALGFPCENARTWSAGGGADHTFMYLICLKAPKKIGSLLVSGTFTSVRILNPGAAWPADPTRQADWTTLAVRPRQSGGSLVTLPPATSTRAILVVHEHSRWRSRIEQVRCFSRRLHNVTNLGHAYADSEYVRIVDLAPPHTFAAADITSGRGIWQNTGKDPKGKIPAPPVSNVAPSWFMVTWEKPRTFSGFWMDSNFEKFDMARFTGPDAFNPKVGTEREWKRIRHFDARRGARSGWFVTFPEPVTTRGLRLTITGVSGREPEVAELSGLHTIVDLGDKPVPPLPASDGEKQVELPPVTVDYELPWDGMATVMIDGPDGRRVRNLVTRADRTAGPHREGWDLNDDQGIAVKPGKYTVKIIAHPPLDLRYQFTVYPNVSQLIPENSAWLNGVNGPGGWMADHGAPSSIAVAASTVYLGSPCAESGVSLIETDLRGAKRWGYHTLHEGFGGPWFLATDNKYVYVAARATMLWSFDIETKQKRQVLDRAQTARRKDHITGMAARDGVIYLAQNVQPWLVNAMSDDDVDVERCIPRQPPTRNPRFPHECVPDPRGDFLRLLRLRDTPPGHGGDIGLVYLDSTESKWPRQYTMVAFKRAVPVGSIVFPVPRGGDYKVSFSYLKADAPYPPNPAKRGDWVAFGAGGKAPWDVVAAPEGVMTRALLITFSRKGAELLDEGDQASQFDGNALLETTTKLSDQPKDDLGSTLAGGLFKGRLEGLKILRRRYENAARDAEVRVNSGKVSKDGVWDAGRKKAVSHANPGIYALAWKAPQALRGLALKEMDGRVAEVDVYDGPAGALDIAGSKGWRTVATYKQPLRLYYFPNALENKRARYMDGYIPFENEVTTRAVRIRIVAQYVRQEVHYPHGFREDEGAADWDVRRCGLAGVAALRYLGGESATDPLLCQRVEAIDAGTGEVKQEVYVPNPGVIAFGPEGRLHGVSDRKIVRIDFEKGEHAPIITDLIAPTALAFDAAGRAYVFDNAPARRNIRVYDPAGMLVRTIGKAGGRKVPGPWDAETFVNVTGLGVDRTNQLWVVENNYWPKRVSVWTTEGKFIKEFLGPTAYGSGGMLDPWNKKRFFYGPLEFELNWEKGTSRIKQITSAGEALLAPQLPVKIGDRMYLTSHQGWDAHGAVAVVYQQDGETYRRVAAFGKADDFPPMSRPEALDALHQKTLQGKIFIWADLNGDEQFQPDEVRIEDRPRDYYGVGKFNRRLASIAGTHQYYVRKFLPSGVPVFERTHRDGMDAQFLWEQDNGLFHRMHSNWRHEGSDAWMKADGEIVATYPSEPNSGFALPRAKPYTRDQVVCQFKWVGDETAPGGDLGEFLVVNSNVAQWYLWTADGLLAGRIFRDMRDPKAIPWSMKEHERGLELRDVNIGQEHFEGYFTRTFEDDKFYCVAGHNHASLVEVKGLDKFRRWNKPLPVTLAALVKTEQWLKRRQLAVVRRRAPVINCYQLARRPRLDRDARDWDFVSADMGENLRFSMGLKDEYLYVCYQVEGLGPLKNTGEDWHLLFKTGGAVDLQLGRDPNADPARRAPAAGDMRLLMTFVKGQPVAVLYEPVAAGAKPGEAWTVTSPVSSEHFDRVRRLTDVRMVRRETGRGYVFEAAVPLKSIGLTPADGMRLKVDWGILRTGPDGYEVLQRIYWANKATGITADSPSEARLSPDLWGYLLLHTAKGGPGSAPVVDEHTDKLGGKEPQNEFKAIEEELGD